MNLQADIKVAMKEIQGNTTGENEMCSQILGIASLLPLIVLATSCWQNRLEFLGKASFERKERPMERMKRLSSRMETEKYRRHVSQVARQSR